MKKKTTVAGFEPTHPEDNWFQVNRLRPLGHTVFTSVFTSVLASLRRGPLYVFSCVSRHLVSSIVRECSSDGRALALHARGRGIDTPHFHCIVYVYCLCILFVFSYLILSSLILSGGILYSALIIKESVKNIKGRENTQWQTVGGLAIEVVIGVTSVSVSLIERQWTNYWNQQKSSIV